MPLPATDFASLSRGEIRAAFDREYERLYGRTYPDSPVELVSFRVRASLPVQQLRLPEIDGAGRSLDRARKGTRPAYSAESRGFAEFQVFDRYGLPPDEEFAGPAIVEERESTVVIDAGATARLDGTGFLWVDLPGATGRG